MSDNRRDLGGQEEEEEEEDMDDMVEIDTDAGQCAPVHSSSPLCMLSSRSTELHSIARSSRDNSLAPLPAGEAVFRRDYFLSGPALSYLLLSTAVCWCLLVLLRGREAGEGERPPLTASGHMPTLPCLLPGVHDSLPACLAVYCWCTPDLLPLVHPWNVTGPSPPGAPVAYP